MRPNRWESKLSLAGTLITTKKGKINPNDEKWLRREREKAK